MRASDLDVPSIEALAQALRRTIEYTRVTMAPTEVLARARAAVEEAAALLEPHRHPGPYMQLGLEGREVLRAAGESPGDLAPHELFPYSPMTGRRNALSPPLTFEVDGERVLSRGVFGPAYTGPPGSVHGGVIALAFDELLGYVNVVNRSGAFTGTLTIRYLRMTPIGVPVEMEAHTDRTEGRKVFARGSMYAEGELTAEAEGVFIRTGGSGPRPA